MEPKLTDSAPQTSDPRIAIIVFPGSNCEVDAYHVVRNVARIHVDYIWHEETCLSGYDCIVLPGGFSYGDHLRCGAIAQFSPVMTAVTEEASKGKLVIGICNGFQVLTESHLLPGALIRNAQQRFVCRFVNIRCENPNTPFTKDIKQSEILRIPVAHGEGQYIADSDTLEEMTAHNQIVFRYCDKKGQINGSSNPNGSQHAIAGVCDRNRNVFGLMPHPERCSESILGSADGLKIWQSIKHSLQNS